MTKQTDLNLVRKAVIKHIGQKVKVMENKGRHKVDITEGVIAETYPSIFLIQVGGEMKEAMHTMSFSYTDVLTKNVQLTLCN